MRLPGGIGWTIAAHSRSFTRLPAFCNAFAYSMPSEIFRRYKASGFEALSNRSHRPVRYANQYPQSLLHRQAHVDR